MSDPRAVLASLPELQPESGKHLSDSLITGMTRSLTRARHQLIRWRSNPSGYGNIYEPTDGTASLLSRTHATRKLMTLSPGVEENFTYMLNTGLLGGESYPILTAVLGTIAGAASAGAGLLFTIASTGLSLSQTSQRVLARGGDELWQVEEIGKSRESGLFGGESTVAVHVGSYFLVDAYRSRSGARNTGWLIHEERQELTLT
jgi:hypothetical protein